VSAMNVACSDRERIFLDGTGEEWAALEAHASKCASCRAEVDAWKGLSRAATELHAEWDSAWLWPRIERALAEDSARRRSSRWARFADRLRLAPLGWQTAAAGLLLAALTAGAVWFIAPPTPDPGNIALLPDPVVREVERAEAAYEQAIDKLDTQARPQLENSSTPLLASYREKLQVLDSAIAELKSEARMNPGNGHLRRQLLAMYLEKQHTLEQVLEAKP
jgi:hypothetical protein